MAKRKYILLALLGGISFGAQSGGLNYYDEMGRMDAQINLLRKQSELRTALSTLGDGAAVGLPTISAIFDGKTGLRAQLVFKPGGLRNVKAGDRIGEIQIANIDLSGVWVQIGKRKIPLSYTDLAAQPGAPGTTPMPIGIDPPVIALPELPPANVAPARPSPAAPAAVPAGAAAAAPSAPTPPLAAKAPAGPNR